MIMSSEGSGSPAIGRSGKMTGKETRAVETEARVRRKPGPTPGTEAAKHGGQAAAAKHGKEFYRQIGKKGGSRVRDTLGSGYYSRIGRVGGEASRQKYGRDHYARIGKLGAQHRGQRAEGT
jgi:general stress protein YciG